LERCVAGAEVPARGRIPTANRLRHRSARGAPGIVAEIPQAPQGAEELERKARFLARERQKGAHLFLDVLTVGGFPQKNALKSQPRPGEGRLLDRGGRFA
jgi:hypothetical protein